MLQHGADVRLRDLALNPLVSNLGTLSLVHPRRHENLKLHWRTRTVQRI